MAAVTCSLGLGFLFILSAGCVEDVYIKTESSKTFGPRSTKALSMVEWKHNRDLVVEWSSANDLMQYRYGGQAKLNQKSGELTLTGVTKTFDGEYKCQYQLEGEGSFKEIIYNVKVIDPVSKPRVTCTKNDTRITLECTMDSSVKADFEWSGPNGISYKGTSIVRNCSSETADTYFCTAKNKVSEMTTEFKVASCPCQDDEASTNHVGVIVGSLCGVVGAGIIGVLGYLYYTKRDIFNFRLPASHDYDAAASK